MAQAADRKREWKREWRQARVAADRGGPLAAKRCRCEHPVTQRDLDGERWCIFCGRLWP